MHLWETVRYHGKFWFSWFFEIWEFEITTYYCIGMHSNFLSWIPTFQSIIIMVINEFLLISGNSVILTAATFFRLDEECMCENKKSLTVIGILQKIYVVYKKPPCVALTGSSALGTPLLELWDHSCMICPAVRRLKLNWEQFWSSKILILEHKSLDL